MPPDPAKKLADLVQQAGRLHSLPEHSRAEHERELPRPQGVLLHASVG